MKPSENASAAAVAMFAARYNCAQAVCAAFAPSLGLTREQAFQIAAAMGAGVARQRDVCGAVSGAIMALGLRHGRNLEQDAANNGPAYAAAEEFIRRFKERHRSIICRELLPYDAGTAAGRQQALAAGAFKDICVVLVRSAVEILEAMQTEAPTS